MRHELGSNIDPFVAGIAGKRDELLAPGGARTAACKLWPQGKCGRRGVPRPIRRLVEVSVGPGRKRLDYFTSGTAEGDLLSGARLGAAVAWVGSGGEAEAGVPFPCRPGAVPERRPGDGAAAFWVTACIT